MNKVIIGLNEYNELFKFKEKIEAGFVIVNEAQYNHFNGYSQNTTYITTDEAVQKLAKQVDEQSLELSKIKIENAINLQLEINKIKEFSILEFIKFRKTK